MNNRILFSLLLFGAGSFVACVGALLGQHSGEVYISYSGDLNEWERLEITPEMVTAEGGLVLSDLPNPVFFRMDVTDFVGSAAPAVMVLVEGGTLSTTNELNGAVVSTFYIGRYEVTWGEWKEVRSHADANGYDIGSAGEGCADDHPVHSVNWYDVLKWCNLKSEIEGLTPVYTVEDVVYRSGEFGMFGSHIVEQNLSANGYRLPLEAEWEFAARGGNQSNGYTYAGSNDLNAVGWYGDNSGGAACPSWEAGPGTWPVGQKAANELGLYDMSGNVWEWCWDFWTRHSPDRDRVLRGTGWDSLGGGEVWWRYGNPPSGTTSARGFRLARTPSP